jgi:hypothetical protein
MNQRTKESAIGTKNNAAVGRRNFKVMRKVRMLESAPTQRRSFASHDFAPIPVSVGAKTADFNRYTRGNRNRCNSLQTKGNSNSNRYRFAFFSGRYFRDGLPVLQFRMTHPRGVSEGGFGGVHTLDPRRAS